MPYRVECTRVTREGQQRYLSEWHTTLRSADDAVCAHRQAVHPQTQHPVWDSVKRVHVEALPLTVGGKRALASGKQLALFAPDPEPTTPEAITRTLREAGYDPAAVAAHFRAVAARALAQHKEA